MPIWPGSRRRSARKLVRKFQSTPQTSETRRPQPTTQKKNSINLKGAVYRHNCTLSKTADRAECILLVDDDPQTLRYVRDTLAGAGYSPVATGEHGQIARIVRGEQPVLVLLNLMLPRADGIEPMQTVPELSRQPVVFISGYGRDETVARALEAGAADYIVKPCSPTELVARVRAALRRRADPEPFVLGELSIDYDRRLVTVAGRAVELTPTEYELLRALSLDAGKVVSYETLLHQNWSERRYASWKVVRAFVKQLRAKLGDDAADPAWIFNVRGVGYRMPRSGETP